MITEGFKKEVSKLIKSHCESTGISQAKLSNSIKVRYGSVSIATISNMVSGKWDNISDRLWEHVGDYFGMNHNKRFQWSIRMTHNMDIIHKLCAAVHSERNMMAICGTTGLGKTEALDRYSRLKDNVFYVLVRKSMTMKEFLQDVARSMHLQVEGSINAHVRRTTGKLIALGGLLILDDMGKRIEKLYGVLQEMYDLVEGKAGIIIAGTPALKFHIDKHAALGGMKTKDSYPELQRRISYWQRLYPPTEAMVRQVCSDYNIIEEAAVKYVHRQCQDYGTLKEMMRAASFLKEEKITASMLEGLPIGSHAWEA